MGSLALAHAKRTPRSASMSLDLKRDDLTDAQAGRVRREQQRAVLRAERAGEQPRELFAGENLRQLGRLPSGRDHEARALGVEPSRDRRSGVPATATLHVLWLNRFSR